MSFSGPSGAAAAGARPAMAVAAKKKVKQRRHHFLVSGTKFIVDTFYTPIKQVGSGAYGVVWYVHGRPVWASSLEVAVLVDVPCRWHLHMLMRVLFQ